MSEERDSQLSAMFDGELSAAECELLARRLAKDDALRSEWSRYALIGAAIRADAGVRLDFRVAERVAVRLATDGAVAASAGEAEMQSAVASAAGSTAGGARWYKPLAGFGIAASVAAASILWIRADQSAAPQLAAVPTAEISRPVAVAANVAPAPSRAAEYSNGEPASYVVPPVNASASSIAPAALANYVVAHSEFSGPLSRRMVLSGLVGNEVPVDEAQSDAPSVPDTEVANGAR
jgi:sigma-E factor negative regulatory protein RseA